MTTEEMLKSDDAEIAILGAKLMLQQDEKEALKLSNLKCYMDFYKDKKGEFHIVRALKFDNSNGHIHILSENEIEKIVSAGYIGDLIEMRVDLETAKLIKQEYEQRKTVTEHNI